MGNTFASLVDTGWTTTLVTPMGTKIAKGKNSVREVDGSETERKGSSDMALVMRGTRQNLRVILIDHVVNGSDVVIRVDSIYCLGGVSVGGTVVLFVAV